MLEQDQEKKFNISKAIESISDILPENKKLLDDDYKRIKDLKVIQINIIIIEKEVMIIGEEKIKMIRKKAKKKKMKVRKKKKKFKLT